MKILHLSKDDVGGGAGKAAFRLHQGLRSLGIDSQMLVMEKKSDDEHVREIPKGFPYLISKTGGRIENFVAKRFLDPGLPWDLGLAPTFLRSLVRAYRPDVVNLHWINRGMASVADVRKLGIPTVWTFHDMWAITAGYHYYGDSLEPRFHAPDGDFDQNVSPRWLAAKLLAHKIRSWRDCPLEVVCPSQWLAQISRRSEVFKDRPVHPIPYGLDQSIYRVRDKEAIRRELNLPTGKRLILFGAASSSADLRKGSDLLLQALKLGLDQGSLRPSETELVVFGQQEAVAELTGIKVHCLGYLEGDEAMAQAYNTADVFVAPSREDNLPNTVLESLSCGVPVVAFKIGGMPDMIDHGRTGYLASPFDPSDLLRGIVSALDPSPAARAEISARCREVAGDRYDLARQAKAYCGVYQGLIQL